MAVALKAEGGYAADMELIVHYVLERKDGALPVERCWLGRGTAEHAAFQPLQPAAVYIAAGEKATDPVRLQPACIHEEAGRDSFQHALKLFFPLCTHSTHYSTYSKRLPRSL